MGIWRDLLGHSEINPDDDFFKLGGNSLIGINLVTRINRTFKIKLPMSAIFRERTVSKLAVLVKNSKAHNTESVSSQKKKADMNGVMKLIG
jgi:acyl carrier protein